MAPGQNQCDYCIIFIDLASHMSQGLWSGLILVNVTLTFISVHPHLFLEKYQGIDAANDKVHGEEEEEEEVSVPK